ncbi:hypothetical protein [Streptomyces bicolor]|uniref:hypothetical protein n=1 Tax=Streptomyces bicolor TaxID=66874 RepID=UPI00131E5EAD|nr:hypothetical protein [Streptomyces bicolor]
MGRRPAPSGSTTFLRTLVSGAAHASVSADTSAGIDADGVPVPADPARRRSRMPEQRARTRRSGAIWTTSASSDAPPLSGRTVVRLQNSGLGTGVLAPSATLHAPGGTRSAA